MFEKLESRRLFAVAASVNVNNGVLSIAGDAANDVVEVSKLNAQQIVVNDFTTGQSSTFIAEQVSSIRFEGAAGSDSFTVIEGTGTRRLNLPVTALGAEGNDTLVSTGGADRLEGGAGDDSLTSGGGNDTLFGNAGIDNLSAGEGDDLMNGGTDKDTMSGSDGNDTVSYEDRSARVKVTLRTNISLSNGEEGEADVIVRSENAIGGSGSDILTGFAAANQLFGRAGNDKIKGLGGNDRLEGGSGNDTLSGAEGADDMFGNSGNDLMSGGADADDMQGGTGNDTMVGGSGRDAIEGNSGDDFIFAQDGQFEASGGDLINAGAGTDFADTDANDQVAQVEELLN